MLTIPIASDASGVGITSTAISTKQALDVNIAGGSFSVGVVDLSTFTAGTSSEQTIGGVFNDGLTAVTSGQQAAARITTNRALHINLRSAAGVELGLSQANGLNVLVGDGSRVAAVKAASTPAVATDQALVVAVSPGTPVLLGAGSAIIGKVSQDNTVQWSVQDLADGSVAPGTAGTKSMLGGGVFTSGGVTLTTGQQAALQLSAAGRLLVDGSGVTQPVSNANDNAATSTPIGVAASASSVSILALNTARKGFILVNDSAFICYVTYGATSSATAYTVKMQPQATYTPDKNFTGAISAIWLGAVGKMYGAELT